MKALQTTKAMSKTPALKECDEATLILERFKQGDGINGQHVVFEFYVEAARGPHADRPGARVSEVYLLTGEKKKDATKLSLIRAVTDALGLEPEDLGAAWSDAAEKTEDGVPREDYGYLCRGFRVRVSCAKDTRVRTDAAGRPMEPRLLKSWFRVEDQTAASVAAAKRILAGTPA